MSSTPRNSWRSAFSSSPSFFKNNGIVPFNSSSYFSILLNSTLLSILGNTFCFALTWTPKAVNNFKKSPSASLVNCYLVTGTITNGIL